MPDQTAAVPGREPVPVMISVRGEANIEVDPELCEFTVVVQARDKDRRAVLERLTQRNNEVLDEVRKVYGDAVEKLESSRISVYPEQRGRDEKIRAYLGSVRIQVVVKDFTVLGEMLIRLADAEMRQVDGPYWRLRRDSDAYREARTQAVGEAVTRAREYAAALGSEIVSLLELADTGLSTHGVAGPQPMMRMMAMAPGGAAQDASAPVLDLEPQRQNVYASVEARFTATPPASL
jgi:uncharacterized protein YggE